MTSWSLCFEHSGRTKLPMWWLMWPQVSTLHFSVSPKTNHWSLIHRTPGHLQEHWIGEGLLLNSAFESRSIGHTPGLSKSHSQQTRIHVWGWKRPLSWDHLWFSPGLNHQQSFKEGRRNCQLDQVGMFPAESQLPVQSGGQIHLAANTI